MHYHSLTSGGPSSLLDKHLTSNSRSTGTSQYNNNNSNSKYSSGVKAEYSQEVRSSRVTTTAKGTTPTSSSAISNKTVKSIKRANSGGDDDHHANANGAGGAGQSNYGIIDESNTTLWDLKDGPDGPHGKPRECCPCFSS